MPAAAAKKETKEPSAAAKKRAPASSTSTKVVVPPAEGQGANVAVANPPAAAAGPAMLDHIDLGGVVASLVQLDDLVKNQSPLHPVKLTKNQRLTLAATLAIPHGKLAPYSVLSAAVDFQLGRAAPRGGAPAFSRAQAAGAALKVNAFSPTVPCHRVISKDGALTAHLGSKEETSILAKAALLRAEGHSIVRKKKAGVEAWYVEL